jgi:lipid-A-disaccharide synthase-like uncharacterized protein
VPFLFELFGILGIAISALAYVPQVVHLARERCSAGISRRAWAMWLASGLLVGALAIHRRDPVFILLQISNLTSTSLILLLSWRYRGMVCETHAPPQPAARPELGRCLRLDEAPANGVARELDSVAHP